MSEYLQSVDATEAVAVMRHCKDLRHVHRFHRNGFTNDRGRTMRKVASIPISFLFDAELSKYFDKDMDPHERRKHLDSFLRKHPEFLTVDSR